MEENTPRARIRLPTNLDVDRLTAILLDDVKVAAQRWKSGRPLDESAFLSHLTGVLNRNRKGCDVGKTRRMRAKTQLYFLHREESDCSDKYGADLAVTLKIGRTWIKTAIFQLKKSKHYKFTIDSVDLKSSAEDERIADRSFLLAIDENRLGVRLEKITELNKHLKSLGGQKSMTCRADQWIGLSDWLGRWLKCELSPPTQIHDPNPVEGLLEAFRYDGPEPEEEFSFEAENVDHLTVPPSKTWMKVSVQEV